MGNAMYTDKMACYDTLETCNQGCGQRFDCIFVDKCNGNSNEGNGGYACVPFDVRFFMWLLVAIFLVVVLVCSGIVVCYLLRAIRASFRNSIGAEGDIVFYNARNVHTFPHPATSKY